MAQHYPQFMIDRQQQQISTTYNTTNQTWNKQGQHQQISSNTTYPNWKKAGQQQPITTNSHTAYPNWKKAGQQQPISTSSNTTYPKWKKTSWQQQQKGTNTYQKWKKPVQQQAQQISTITSSATSTSSATTSSDTTNQKRKNKSKKKAVPEGWLNYRSVGNTIPTTRIFAFKVPLKEATCQNLQPGEKFTTIDLFTILRQQRRRLGLVIDLTNTERYYNSTEITDKNVEYVKIFTEGHFVPRPAIVEKFKDTVMKFFSRNRGNHKLVGVHCTHGVNRTGYLICRYMVDCLKWAPDEAIAAFNYARGHDLERENYLDDLKIRDPRDPDKTEEVEEAVGGQMFSTKTDFSSDDFTGNRRFSKRKDDFVFDPSVPIQSLLPEGDKSAARRRKKEQESAEQSVDSYQQFVQACGMAIQLYQQMSTNSAVMQQVVANAPNNAGHMEEGQRGNMGDPNSEQYGDMYDPNNDQYEGGYDQSYDQSREMYDPGVDQCDEMYNQGRERNFGPQRGNRGHNQSRCHPYGQRFDQSEQEDWGRDGPPHRGRGPPHRGRGGAPHRGGDGPPHRGGDGPPHRGRGGPPHRGRGGPPHRGRGGPPHRGRGGMPHRGRGGFLGDRPRFDQGFQHGVDFDDQEFQHGADFGYQEFQHGADFGDNFDDDWQQNPRFDHGFQQGWDEFPGHQQEFY